MEKFWKEEKIIAFFKVYLVNFCPFFAAYSEKRCVNFTIYGPTYSPIWNVHCLKAMYSPYMEICMIVYGSIYYV